METLALTCTYPLRTPFHEFDPVCGRQQVAICTLMATDEGADWIDGHQHTVTEAATAFTAAVLGADLDEQSWVSAHFEGFTLATRGRAVRGSIAVALLELDQEISNQEAWA